MSNVNFDYMFNPPTVYEIDVMRLPDIGMPCEFCEGGHVVAKVSEESRHGWGKYIPMCAGCLYSKYEVTVEQSKFDQD